MKGKSDKERTKPKNLLLVTDPRIDTLMKYMLQNNMGTYVTPGYRVQIYFGSERAKANETKIRFLREFPEEFAYMTYQQPNFKVRVGDYRTRSEANSVLNQIKQNYPISFIVNDMVTIRKRLLNEDF